MSPSDLGQLLKPFIFLDLFDAPADAFKGFGLHPHSGIATLTWLIEGATNYDDTTGQSGVLVKGGLEWMQAGSGVVHELLGSCVGTRWVLALRAARRPCRGLDGRQFGQRGYIVAPGCW